MVILITLMSLKDIGLQCSLIRCDTKELLLYCLVASLITRNSQLEQHFNDGGVLLSFNSLQSTLKNVKTANTINY